MMLKRENGIDFLCIGVQKSATSWLWSNLKKNKDIWMPPRKELHYFDRSLKYPSPSFLATDNILLRLFSRNDHDVLFRKNLRKELRDAFKTKDISNILWFLKYYFGNYNDKWYLSLFKNSKGKLRGEISPAYSILDPVDVLRVRSLFPDLKIILILRNPIERAWSQVRFFMTRKLIKLESDLDEMIEFIESPAVSSRGEYVKILDTWYSFFPKEQIHIGFYDEVKNDPSAFLLDVFDFLKVKKPADCKANLRGKINLSLVKEMPEAIEKYLANKYRPDLEKLAELMPTYPKLWLDECNRILQQERIDHVGDLGPIT